MKPRSRRERISAQLADLKMPGALEALDEVLAGVDGGGTTAAEAIERLLAAQIALRNSRRLVTAMPGHRGGREQRWSITFALRALGLASRSTPIQPISFDRFNTRARVGSHADNDLPD